MLVTGVIAEADALGFEDLWLYHESVHTLYERLGWRFIAPVPHQGGTAVLMKRALGESAGLA